MNKIILDIGCGHRKAPNSIGVDIRRTRGADIIADVCRLSLRIESIDEIICSKVLEHVDDLVKATEENHRVLKPGVKVMIKVPHVKSLDAFRDLTQKNFFTIAIMDYFTGASSYSYYRKAKFRIINKSIILTEQKFKWLERIYNFRPEFTEHFLLGYFKPHIRCELEKADERYEK